MTATARKRIGMEMNMMDIVIAMSEGNPGAIRVLSEVIKRDHMNVIVLLDMDDMNMRGSQIWVGYKDHCGQDIDKFIAACRSRDADMIATVNKHCPDYAAVTYGASFDR